MGGGLEGPWTRPQAVEAKTPSSAPHNWLDVNRKVWETRPLLLLNTSAKPRD